MKDTWRRGRPIIAASRPDDSDMTIKRRNEKTLLAGTPHPPPSPPRSLDDAPHSSPHNLSA